MHGSKRAIGTRQRVHVRTVVIDNYESFNHGRIGFGFDCCCLPRAVPGKSIWCVGVTPVDKKVTSLHKR